MTKENIILKFIFEKFVNNLSDDVKWKKINLNLVTIKKHFQDISKSINNIDIQKATLFERNIRNLIDKNKFLNIINFGSRLVNSPLLN